MKFEIDDKTGMNEKIWNEKILYFRISRDGFMCKISDGKNDEPVLHLDLKDLEQILQAVKKTHEKILNKQIQEIQDSKNTISNDEIDEMLLQRKIFTPHMDALSIEKIEQNQKIVDEIDECFGDDIHNQPALIQDRADAFFEKYGKRLQ